MTEPPSLNVPECNSTVAELLAANPDWVSSQCVARLQALAALAEELVEQMDRVEGAVQETCWLQYWEPFSAALQKARDAGLGGKP